MAAPDDISFTVAPGRIVGLLGPNGSEKSTFIKCAAGLLTPTQGTLMICGLSIGLDTKAKVSCLPHKNYLNEHLNIRRLFDYFHDFYNNFDKNKSYEKLQRGG